MKWFTDLPFLVKLLIGLAAVMTGIGVAAAFGMARKTSKDDQDAEQPPVEPRIVPRVAVNPSHDYGPECSTAPSPVVDKPTVVTVTPRLTPMEALQAATRNRTAAAKLAAEAAAGELRSRHKRENVAEKYGYASIDSMRKALNRWGYRLNGQLKEVKG